MSSLPNRPWIVMIGNNIKIQRKKQGLTQEQLAEKMCLDVTTVSRHERGMNVSLEILSEYAEALQCSIYSFIPESNQHIAADSPPMQNVIYQISRMPAEKQKEFLSILNSLIAFSEKSA